MLSSQDNVRDDLREDEDIVDVPHLFSGNKKEIVDQGSSKLEQNIITLLTNKNLQGTPLLSSLTHPICFDSSKPLLSASHFLDLP